MERYIDADKAKELWSGDHPTQIAMRVIFDELPTADVAPKSEVKKLENTYNRAIRKIDNKTITAIRIAKQEVAREIFEEIEKMLIDSTHIPDCSRFVDIDKLAELKKKYTEGKNEQKGYH